MKTQVESATSRVETQLRFPAHPIAGLAGTSFKHEHLDVVGGLPLGAAIASTLDAEPGFDLSLNIGGMIEAGRSRPFILENSDDHDPSCRP